MITTRPLQWWFVAAGASRDAGAAWSASAWAEAWSAVECTEDRYIAVCGTPQSQVHNTPGSEFEFDFGIGAAGAEVVLATFRSGDHNYTISGSDQWYFYFPAPLLIPVGTRLAFRFRASVTTAVSLVSPDRIGYYTSYDVLTHKCSTFGCLRPAADGASVIPSGSSGTFGAWAEISANIGEVVTYVYGISWTVPVLGLIPTVELGLGGAGAETPFTTLIWRQGSNYYNMGFLKMIRPYIVPAGSRISARIAINSTSTLAWKITALTVTP